MGKKKMNRLLVCLCGLFVALSALADEAPDKMVQRVSEEVLAVIRSDKDMVNSAVDMAGPNYPRWHSGTTNVE